VLRALIEDGAVAAAAEATNTTLDLAALAEQASREEQ
jgi:hypothetical protein